MSVITNSNGITNMVKVNKCLEPYLHGVFRKASKIKTSLRFEKQPFCNANKLIKA